MLKITAVHNDERTTLVLEGQLADPWISELERTWSEAGSSNSAHTIVVDLRDVTAISERGQDVLFQMMTAGTEIRCRHGILTRHVLHQLKHRCKAQSRKATHP